ncbi:arginyltransferase 1 isoform X4 [Rhynchophorus ferrugineus]|uniref:arginyltransferase 1 isoform X4 n=1 Tax=Rhynchophorus ferrugineus TaxID=354439 RepID=UPI003FCE1AD5
MMDILSKSLALWHSELDNRCGYCKQSSGNISYGMTTENLSVQDYKNLIDRGWRRSGNFCYKPTMNKTCCPQYTIRCDVENFSVNKSHKKIIKKFNSYLKDGMTLHCNLLDVEEQSEGNEEHIDIKQMQVDIANMSSDIKMNTSEGNIVGDACSSSNTITANTMKSVNAEENVNCETSNVKKLVKAGKGPDPNKPPCKKAKLLRLERKKQKSLFKNIEIPKKKQINNSQKSLYDLLQDIPPDSSLDLKHEPFPEGVYGPGYGSFHQQYWIGEKLIAVGVIDILPGCVSSVYFFYDPDYSNLSLGTYGILREIQLVERLRNVIPDLKYYYMGYYIHSCPKMRYKGKLRPSYLLCPETYVWMPIENCLPKLDVNKYSRLNDDPDASEEDQFSEMDLCDMKIFSDHKILDARTYLCTYKSSRNKVFNMARLIGKNTVHNLIFLMK